MEFAKIAASATEPHARCRLIRYCEFRGQDCGWLNLFYCNGDPLTMHRSAEPPASTRITADSSLQKARTPV